MIIYVKINSDNSVSAAPKTIIKDEQMITGYNNSSNEEMLFADGYVKYDGDIDVENLSYIDGQFIEKTEEEPTNTIFTKLQIRRALRLLGKENILNNALASTSFKNEWNDAQDINLNDEFFVKALNNLGITEETINLIIETINTNQLTV